jgi:hypothetical protein
VSAAALDPAGTPARGPRDLHCRGPRSRLHHAHIRHRRTLCCRLRNHPRDQQPSRMSSLSRRGGPSLAVIASPAGLLERRSVDGNLGWSRPTGSRGCGRGAHALWHQSVRALRRLDTRTA